LTTGEDFHNKRKKSKKTSLFPLDTLERFEDTIGNRREPFRKKQKKLKNK